MELFTEGLEVTVVDGDRRYGKTGTIKRIDCDGREAIVDFGDEDGWNSYILTKNLMPTKAGVVEIISRLLGIPVPEVTVLDLKPYNRVGTTDVGLGSKPEKFRVKALECLVAAMEAERMVAASEAARVVRDKEISEIHARRDKVSTGLFEKVYADADNTQRLAVHRCIEMLDAPVDTDK